MFRGQITLFKNIPDAKQLQTTVGASMLPSAEQSLLLANQAGPGFSGCAFGFISDDTSGGGFP